MATPNIKTKFTNTKGETVTVFNDGTKTRLKGEPEQAPVISTETTAPEPDFNITKPDTPTQTDGMLGGIQESTDAFTKNLEAERKKQEAQFSQSQTDVQSFIKGIRGETGLQAEEYAKGGTESVNTTQSELNDINQQIKQEQRALDNKLRAIDERGGGLAGGALSEKENIRRESLKTQADLSIIQQGVQGRFDSAKAIADRAVSAYIEKQDIELKALEFNYQNNKDLFTKAEQREFETAQADRQARLDAEKENKKNIYDFAIKAMEKGAPASVVQSIMGSKNVSEALKQGAGYFVPKSTTEKPTLQNFGTSDAPNWKQYDPATGTWGAISGLDSVPTVTSPLAIASAKTKINNMIDVVSDGGLESAVGPNRIARASFDEAFTAKRANFVASVQSITAELVVGNLIQKKAEGATFGALNEQEFGVIKDSATKINQWAIKDGDKIVGYNTTEANFKKEWDNIQNYAKVDSLLKGVDPESIGVTVTDDGKYWTRDSSGNLVDLEELAQTEFNQ